MKYLFSLLLIITINISFASIPKWGPTGHRTLAQIAEKHIKKKVLHKIEALLDGQSLAYVATYADEIKSDKKYRKFSAWHYVNFPFDTKYEDSKKSNRGDLAVGIAICIQKIKLEKTSRDDKAFYLKMLIHLIGDLHQPLHVGRAEDRGGNDIQVKWHGKDTNLHHVWDENLIDKWNMSYTELADNSKNLTKEEIKKIQRGTVIDWINETQKLAITVYKSAKKGENLKWKYSYDNFGTVERQLQKGGLRLARILNEIFG